jgi:drug/metabolite transporter (DMT)-like permease
VSDEPTAVEAADETVAADAAADGRSDAAGGRDGRGGAVRRWFRSRFGNPSAVYGLIVYTAAIGALSVEDEDDLGAMIVKGLFSLIIFFIAHVFAHTLADHGRLPLHRAIWSGVIHSVGMLYTSIPSTLVLVLGLVLGWDAGDAADYALIASVVMLGILGYSAYAERGARHVIRWVGAAGTAALGLLILVLDYLVH